MITRPKFLRQKDVMLVNDVPVKKEILDQERFSSASNLNLLTALRTGRANVFNKLQLTNHIGINSLNVFFTYLDYSYYGEEDVPGNFDFKQEFKKKTNLHTLVVRGGTTEYLVEKDVETVTEKSVAKHTYYKLETHKDVYVSYRLKEQLDFLIEEIRQTEPKLLIVTGKWGLFFLTGVMTVATNTGNYKDKKPLGGLVTYRASIMELHPSLNLPDIVVYPLYHTVHALSMPDKIPIMELDLQKAGFIYQTIKAKGVEYYKEDTKEYVTGLDKEKLLSYMDSLLLRLDSKPTIVSCDIETMYHSMIDCIGVTDNLAHGLCIPFASAGTPLLWSEEAEVELMVKLREILIHKNCKLLFQNGSYDISYISKLWDINLVAQHDTMVMHHVLYNYLPKDLAFLASLYCSKYKYWKDTSASLKESPETRWVYNCKDIIYTLEIQQVLAELLSSQETSLLDFYNFQQKELAPVLDTVMRRGVLVDKVAKDTLYTFFSTLVEEVRLTIVDLLGEPEFNINSVPQKKKIFTDLLKIDLVKKKGIETTDAAAMKEYIEEYPLYKPLLTLMLEYQSLKIFTTTFLGMKLDEDNRARTQYKIAGTSTYRLSSTKNNFGSGANFQTLPSKGKIDLVYTEQVAKASTNKLIVNNLKSSGLALPNVKKMFLADEGKVFFNVDFSAADARIVAHTANCPYLIDVFAQGLDLYCILASEYYNRTITKQDKERAIFKAITHGSNYAGAAPTLARTAGLLVHEVETVQAWYFGLAPEIPKWHREVQKAISTKGYITNIFGARGWFINSNDPMLINKAVAYGPQSVVGILTNKGLVNIETKEPKIEVLLQTHDSVSGVFLKEDTTALARIVKHMEVTLPYKIPLTIPVDVESSDVSYGDCK